MTSITDFLAAIVISIPIALTLFGIGTAQTYFYYTEYENDPKIFKVAVGLAWIMECVHSALVMHVLYIYTVDGFSNPERIAFIVWSPAATIFLEVMITGLVQSFLTYRAWLFNGRRMIVAVIPGIILFFRIGFGFGTAAYLWKYSTWAAFNSAIGPKYTVNIGLGLGVLVDLTTSLLLIYQMYLSRQHTMTTRSKGVVDSLIRYAIATGVVIVLFSTAVLISYNAQPGALTYAGLSEVLSKLYANTLLANLNARKQLRSTENSSSSTTAAVLQSIQLSNVGSARNAGPKTFKATRSSDGKLEVFKQSETVTHRDASIAESSDDYDSTKHQILSSHENA